ncbi:hypothetical protein T492DRAFT_1067686 [Pavlovales sp. CCMP2436]|nr:hypothetical protein T492DRAFT_1067686 [Pavlovales sp. CCMP2436]
MPPPVIALPQPCITSHTLQGYSPEARWMELDRLSAPGGFAAAGVRYVHSGAGPAWLPRGMSVCHFALRSRLGPMAKFSWSVTASRSASAPPPSVVLFVRVRVPVHVDHDACFPLLHEGLDHHPPQNEDAEEPHRDRDPHVALHLLRARLAD